MQPPGGVLLDHKAALRRRYHRALAAGLGGFFEVALGAVFRERRWRRLVAASARHGGLYRIA
jgi:hypothetical protein